MEAGIVSVELHDPITGETIAYGHANAARMMATKRWRRTGGCIFILANKGRVYVSRLGSRQYKDGLRDALKWSPITPEMIPEILTDAKNLCAAGILRAK
jgi:hypothetical protein